MNNSIAQITNPALSTPLADILKNEGGEGFLRRLLPSLVSLGLIAGSLIFFFMILFGAIQWITSGGDKGAIESARGRIVNAIIGIVILFGLFAIVRVIETFFGTSILTLDIGNLKIE